MAGGAGVLPWLLIACFLGVVNLLANYCYASRFGVYEDDYMFVLPQMGWEWDDLTNAVKVGLLQWPQGRPVWWTIQPIVAFSLGRWDTLIPYYAFGWMLSSAAAFATFLFIRKIVSTRAALVGATWFLIFPVDTSKQLLMHLLQMQLSTIMIVSALALWMNRRIAVSFLVAAVILLNYEPYFLIFGMAPLLVRESTLRGWWMRVFKHGVGCFALLLGVLLLRRTMGENRADEVLGSLSETLVRAGAAMAIGPSVVVGEIGQRLRDVIFLSDAVQWGSIGVTAALLGGLLWWLNAQKTGKNPPAIATAGEWRLPLWQVALAGLGFLIVPYLYRFHEWYYPPVVTVGRLSHMHQPSVLGMCVLCAAAYEGMMMGLKHWRLGRVVAMSSVALVLSLFVSFGQQIQLAEYATNWSQQAALVRGVIEEIPDLQEGEVVLVRKHARLGGEIPQTAGHSRNWLSGFGIDNAFEAFVELPVDWSESPEIHAVDRSARTTLENGAYRIETVAWAEASWPLVTDEEFSQIEWLDGRWQRSNRAVVLDGARLRVREPGGPKVIEPSDLFRNLDKGEFHEEPWPSFENDVWFPSRAARMNEGSESLIE